MNNENVKNNVWKAALAAVILLSVFLLVISIKGLKSIRYVGKDTPAMNVITVNGKGEVISIPDIATFSFSVTENAKNVDEAQAKSATKLNAAIKALKDNGVAEKDIKTIAYNINPHYDYVDGVCPMSSSSVSAMYPYSYPVPPMPCSPGKSALTGYDVSQTIQVKIRDLKKAGALFSTIGSLKVQNVNGLNFSIDNIDEVKAEARELAIKNAKEKAKDLSKQLNVKLVRITSFYEQGDDMNSYYREGMGGDVMNVKVQSAPSPDIPAGEQKVISNVSIAYEIR